MLNKGRSGSVPAAVLVTSLALELVGREDGEDALLRAEVLPLYPRVGLQVVCQHCRGNSKHVKKKRKERKDNGGNRRRKIKEGKTKCERQEGIVRTFESFPLFRLIL